MKKAQGLSLNTIIIAILVILVMVVLSVIFIGQSGSFVDNVGSCSSKGGKCAPSCGDIAYGTEDYSIPYPSAVCSDEQETCCLEIGN